MHLSVLWSTHDILCFVFSDEKNSMYRLRKVLTPASKEGRHRRRLLNIQITFLAWLVESVGFLVIFLGKFILGHESNVFNFFMQTLTLIIYFVILPSVFLLNDYDVKSDIVDSNWYGNVLTIFHCNYINIIDDSEETDEIENDSVKDKQNEDQNHIDSDDTSGSSTEDKGSSSSNRGLEKIHMKNANKDKNEYENSRAARTSTSNQSSSKIMTITDVEDLDLH